MTTIVKTILILIMADQHDNMYKKKMNLNVEQIHFILNMYTLCTHCVAYLINAIDRLIPCESYGQTRRGQSKKKKKHMSACIPNT